MNVEVKVQTMEGKYLLNEIHPSLKDGDVIKAIRVNQKTGCVNFKWHGMDAANDYSISYYMSAAIHSYPHYKPFQPF